MSLDMLLSDLCMLRFVENPLKAKLQKLHSNRSFQLDFDDQNGV